MTRYRIVRDDWLGYEVQSWRWWFPFWIQGSSNTHRTIAEAELYVERRRYGGRVVKYLG